MNRLSEGNIPVGPVEMVVLQSTSFCNLNCSYCYLSEESRRNKSAMAISTIETIFEKLLSSRYVDKTLRVSWHSGEPLILKPSYYREAIERILKIRDYYCLSDFNIRFDIQTNGTLINQEWCDLINEYGELLTIGVSCDGPASLHDLYRKNWSGKPSHTLTQQGMQLLCENGIDFDVIAVVSPESLEHPVEFLEYFSRFSKYIREFHFNLHDEIFIDSEDSKKIESYANKYDLFLRSLLNEISKHENKKFPQIRNFSIFYNMLFGEANGRQKYDARSMSKPFKTLSIEANGDLTTFYAGLTVDECKDLKDLYGDGKGLVVGNVLNASLDEIANSTKLQKIASDFEASHRACEAGCEYFNLCSGGYNLIKFRRFERFNVAQTPECLIHVKTFANTLLSHLNESN
ncbi:radical SAM protein [Methylomarinum sp. Ch1-1]|uniref:Radical SAM protein n=1 Tax=Methylomarinum roseum TaxID=3067653 RepID=A0AAU7NRU4_9GAMM|nr:radical SAM protein [Methylomarinum sp. Ch1-1]MDP4520288.1 radical SAM protein [Methylomarinum sp. Ch1-1]